MKRQNSPRRLKNMNIEGKIGESWSMYNRVKISKQYSLKGRKE